MSSVFKASVHDVRYFAALLRGVNFANRATIIVTEKGLTVIVEEARTLLGTAYIFADIFNEYVYSPQTTSSQTPSQSQNEGEQEMENTTFEVPLNTLLECLNIFGTASGNIVSSGNSNSGKFKKRKDNASEDEGQGHGRDSRPIEHYFGGGTEKRTGMRLSYNGAGHPLTVLLDQRAEDASGPTTSCQISTYEPEPHLDLPFDSQRVVLKIILKSAWLREALSEVDASCNKLTFIGNPSVKESDHDQTTDRPGRRSKKMSSGPMFRIRAAGMFGSTEMDYPDDRDVLESFECGKTVRFSYHLKHIAKTLRALQSSTKTSLRIDDEGLLSLQFLMPAPSSKSSREQASAFTEFRCLALDEGDV